MRNRLAENAKRILNTKSFVDGKNTIEKIVPQQSEGEKTQQEHLAQSGFADAPMTKTIEEPASYNVHKPTGELNFTYKKQPFDSVTKGDPPVKNLQAARYNIITGNLQQWYNK